MLDTISPGTRVNVKIVKQPTSAAAKKTLVRVLSKDAAAKKNQSRLRKARKTSFRQKGRGGRFWDINPVTQHPVKADIGVAGVITASIDVISDLKSVSKFVEVTKA